MTGTAVPTAKDSENGVRSAIITGAASGMGRVTASLLARAGYDLTIVGRRSEMLRSASDEIEEEYGAGVLPLTCDVGGAEAPTEIVSAHLERFGGLDALVTAAGVYIESSMEQLSSSVWDATQAINLRGSALLAVEAAKAMSGSSGGRIVLISSISGTQSEKHAMHYNAAKAGVLSVAKSMAVEYAPKGVTTNAIAPGWVATPQAQSAIDQVSPDDFLWINPLGRPGRAEEVAEVIRWLICDAPSFLTGSTIVVDGGQLAQSPPV